MAADERFDESISTWLEDAAPARLPGRVLEATFERTRRTKQHIGWRAHLGRIGGRRSVFALGGAAAVVVVAALAFGSFGDRPAVGGPIATPDPRSAFLGTWTSTSDADGGTQTMIVSTTKDGGVEIVVTDDVASVCSGTPSTMRGTGQLESESRLVIPEPVYTCDDGSEPQALSGPPLQEQLRNLTFVHDPVADVLTVGAESVWTRDGAAAPSPTTLGRMWPQRSLEEVRQAQERADAGDPAYTWQVDPQLSSFGDTISAGEALGSEIFERFVREELGWEASSGFAIMGYVDGGGHLEGVVFIRCAPGRANPLYPSPYEEMPEELRGCAPTIDDSRYETVRFNVDQPAGRGPSGVWVVTDWTMLEPGQPGSTFEDFYPDFDQRQVEQLAPPSDADVTELLRAFLGARLAGEGAEKYLLPHTSEGQPSPGDEVPILYATTGGSAYERYEIERVLGPVWPTGSTEFKLRLFAEDGTVVEQSFSVVRQDNERLGLAYGSQTQAVPTTEDGQAVPVPYSLLDGEVTFAAAPPWDGTSLDRTFAVLGGVGSGSASQFTMFSIMADPLTAKACGTGPAAADAEALVQSIRSNPSLEATAPVAARVGGIDALRMDVVAPGQLEAGDCLPMVVERISAVGADARMRLYILDLPEGMPARILAIAITAHASQFEYVVEAAAPILDSFRFQGQSAGNPPAGTEPTLDPAQLGSRFDSTIHGISIGHPSGWQTRPATEPWTGGTLDFDSPAADVIFDPALGDRRHLIMASQPLGGLTRDAWKESLPRLCAGSGGAFGNSTVDGAEAFVFTCESVQAAAIITTDDRGYLIRLVAPTDDPGLAETYDWDWLAAALETVDLRPEDAVAAP